jgi:serine/threonine protein kinase
MPLSAGTKLGPYEILTQIGAGGMGEVYRARDTKLDRDVAIKVLAATLAQDPERLARFEREAKVLATLNHPNIAQIYSIEDRALIMELVPGETLKGPLPLETALNYAKQIADALEAAHEKGITHRDLKPANIMITPAGVVKVLDFGLAAVTQPSAASEGDPSNSPTLTMRATQAGMIMGTAGYMSPEQAAGQTVDRRADIWAFGVVLWEMLAGQRLFSGDTVAHILADVLRAPIDYDKLPKDTPPVIRDLLRRCLDRDVKNRLQWIGEARFQLQGYLADPEGGTKSPAPAESLHHKLGGVGWTGLRFWRSHSGLSLTVTSPRNRRAFSRCSCRLRTKRRSKRPAFPPFRRMGAGSRLWPRWTAKISSGCETWILWPRGRSLGPRARVTHSGRPTAAPSRFLRMES